MNKTYFEKSSRVLEAKIAALEKALLPTTGGEAVRVEDHEHISS